MIQWYPECLYLHAMVNNISHENDVPLCEEYNQCLKLKINDTVYLTSILTAEAVSKNNNINEKALKNAIPESLRFNIIECDVRNVV